MPRPAGSRPHSRTVATCQQWKDPSIPGRSGRRACVPALEGCTGLETSFLSVDSASPTGPVLTQYS